MIRGLVAASIAAIMFSAPVLSAAEDRAAAEDEAIPSYESPVLTLLLLPFTVLAKIAATLGTAEAEAEGDPPSER